MTREKEILKAKDDYMAFIGAQPIADEPRNNLDVVDAFINGAEWADKNPISNIEKSLIHLVDVSCEKAVQNTIDKACEWLNTYVHIYCSDDGDVNEKELVEKFKKAMEGGEE